MELKKTLIFLTMVFSLCLVACSDIASSSSIQQKTDVIMPEISSQANTSVKTQTSSTDNTELTSKSTEPQETETDSITELKCAHETYPKEANYAEEVTLQAREIYLDIYSYHSKTRITTVVLNESETEHIKQECSMYADFIVTDPRYDTWDKLNTTLRKCFTENCLNNLYHNSSQFYFEFDNNVYLHRGYGGYEGPEYVQAYDVYDIADNRFSVKMCAYYRIEQPADVAELPAKYKTIDFDVMYILEDGNWKIDSTSESETRMFYHLAYCEDIRF